MGRWSGAVGGGHVLLMTGLLAAVPAATPGQIAFSDQTKASGLLASHHVASCVPEGWLTGGMAAGDFNNDGFQDLFFVGGGGSAPDQLFINNGDGTFTEQAAPWGVAVQHAGCGASIGDFDDDGWLDVYVTSAGVMPGTCQAGQHRLYRNAGSSESPGFTNIAMDAGVNIASPVQYGGFGSAFGDYDIDGDLDLMVASWTAAGEGNRLFRNDGGSFTDVTATAVGDAFAGVWGFQPAFADMDGDGYPELLLAADFETSRYLVNNGDGTFADLTVASGTGLDDNGMGQAVGDLDNDGLFEWFVTSIWEVVPPPGNPGDMLYLNLGNHSYQEISHEAGVNNGGFGWGAVAVDLDQDGWLDLVQVNGATHEPWIIERARVYHNSAKPGPGWFTDVAEQAGLDSTGQGRAVVAMDSENDGDQDLAILIYNGALELWRNDTEPAGNWLRLFLDTSNNPRLAPRGFQARVVATAGGQSQCRVMNSSPSYAATCEQTVHFGLGSAELVDELRIEWPRGYVTVLHDVPVNQHLTVTAPSLADLNADGSVNVQDLLVLLALWGDAGAPPHLRADLDNDGLISAADLLLLLGVWGQSLISL